MRPLLSAGACDARRRFIILVFAVQPNVIKVGIVINVGIAAPALLSVHHERAARGALEEEEQPRCCSRHHAARKVSGCRVTPWH
eukprot:5983095-Prymnesium_polylepis.2